MTIRVAFQRLGSSSPFFFCFLLDEVLVFCWTQSITSTLLKLSIREKVRFAFLLAAIIVEYN